MARARIQNTETRTIRRALLRLQRGVHRRMQSEIRAYTGGHSPSLERYYRQYMKEFRRYHAIASYGELYEELLQTDVVYVGDYHTLRQSQEVALELMERAADETRPLVLALEMISQEHNAHLEAYMTHDLSEEEFLKLIDYERTWNFKWKNYKPLFEAARDLEVKMVGVNHSGSGSRGRFQDRDKQIAKAITQTIAAQPEARIMVLIGDLHLAEKHLPSRVDDQLEKIGIKRKRMIIHQNSDTLYWKMAKRGTADTQVVRLGRGRYCVMEVPPFVKLQSYLSWEQTADDLDLDGFDMKTPTTHNVVNALVGQLAGFLEVPLAPEHVEVYVNHEEAFYAALDSESLPLERVRHILSLTESNRSCFVPEINGVYLPFFSVNHAAEEAMHVLQRHLTGPEKQKANAICRFYASILHYAFGFMASKFVNPRRLAPTEAEMRAFLKDAIRSMNDSDLLLRKQVARLVLQHKEHEVNRRSGTRGRLKQIYVQDDDVHLEVVVALGYMLGDRIYESIMAGRLQRDQLRRMLVASTDDPAELYFDILQLCE